MFSTAWFRLFSVKGKRQVFAGNIGAECGARGNKPLEALKNALKGRMRPSAAN